MVTRAKDQPKQSQKKTRIDWKQLGRERVRPLYASNDVGPYTGFVFGSTRRKKC
jgi:hypothetical protein